jgi:hypothetical protein
MINATVGAWVDTPEKPTEETIICEFTKVLAVLPAIYRLGFIMMFKGLEVSPLTLGFRRRFSNLAIEDQIKVLEALEGSKIYLRRAIIGLKSMVLMTYFSTTEMEKAIGYDHRCLLDLK